VRYFSILERPKAFAFHTKFNITIIKPFLLRLP